MGAEQFDRRISIHEKVHLGIMCIFCLVNSTLLAQCLIPNKEYSNVIKCSKGVKSATKCQELCSGTDECVRFTYNSDSYNYTVGAWGNCCLKKDKPVSMTPAARFTSGPKVCQG